MARGGRGRRQQTPGAEAGTERAALGGESTSWIWSRDWDTECEGETEDEEEEEDSRRAARGEG